MTCGWSLFFLSASLHRACSLFNFNFYQNNTCIYGFKVRKKEAPYPMSSHPEPSSSGAVFYSSKSLADLTSLEGWSSALFLLLWPNTRGRLLYKEKFLLLVVWVRGWGAASSNDLLAGGEPRWFRRHKRRMCTQCLISLWHQDSVRMRVLSLWPYSILITSGRPHF